jgi:TolB-like protein/DNA-binding winged helix-turn-helix (wHTH) protein/Tfp pilus assembly protein PilF
MALKNVYVFGPYQLDPNQRLLFHGSAPVPLTPKALETLIVLVEKRGELVTKEELLTRVWPDTFVEEGTVVRNVSFLRKALGESCDGQEYIETHSKRGYRFVAQVHEIEQAQVPIKKTEIVETDSASAQSKEDKVPGVRSSLSKSLVALAIAIVVFGAGTVVFLRWRSSVPTPPGKLMLAVLPFENLSTDRDQDYLGDGLTEELITQLGSLNPERLAVIARTSAIAYRNARTNVHDIGRELKVDLLLEGTVRRDGDRIRVSTQLVRVSDQSTLWTANYDRELRDVLAVESDVARSVASQIALRLSSEQSSRLADARPVDAQAYELYLKGRLFWNRRTPESIDKAIDLLQRAIARDPSYARAHAALADCYVILSIYRTAKPVVESLKVAQEEANRALELDPTLGEAHATLAYSYLYDWNFPAAEAEFQESLRLTPRYATAHQWYAEYLRMMNRQQEAIAESDRALEIDPLSPIINVEAALPYYYLGQNDKAAAQLLRTIDLDPYFASAHGHLCRVYDARGEYRQALQECLAAKALGDANWIEDDLARTYVHTGQAEKARAILRKVPYSEIYLALGDKRTAMAELERSFAEHEPTLVGMKVDPRLAPLRDEPRFQAMLRRIGFPN